MRRFISIRGMVVMAFVWLAIPAVALADDCSAWTLGEVPSCLLLGALLPPFLVAAAILAAANWMRGQASAPATPAHQQFPRQFNTWQEFHEWAEETDYDGPPPSNLVPGGVPPVNLPPTP
jgi:hypothetical protein